MPSSQVQTLVSVTNDPIHQEYFAGFFDHVDIGAVVYFHGVTRRRTVVDGQEVLTKSLAYEAHRPMATAELERIATEAVARFDLLRLLIVHRLGEVPIGETSVLVGSGGPHRRDTIDAVSWIMEALKRDVPIWKREQDDSGGGRWVHPT